MSQALNCCVKVASVSKVQKPSHRLREKGHLSFKKKMEYDLFHQWEPIINAHKNSPHTEIEIRLGRKSGHKFDTNVGKESFVKVL